MPPGGAGGNAEGRRRVGALEDLSFVLPDPTAKPPSVRKILPQMEVWTSGRANGSVAGSGMVDPFPDTATLLNVLDLWLADTFKPVTFELVFGRRLWRHMYARTAIPTMTTTMRPAPTPTASSRAISVPPILNAVVVRVETPSGDGGVRGDDGWGEGSEGGGGGGGMGGPIVDVCVVRSAWLTPMAEATLVGARADAWADVTCCAVVAL